MTLDRVQLAAKTSIRVCIHSLHASCSPHLHAAAHGPSDQIQLSFATRPPLVRQCALFYTNDRMDTSKKRKAPTEKTVKARKARQEARNGTKIPKVSKKAATAIEHQAGMST